MYAVVKKRVKEVYILKVLREVCKAKIKIAKLLRGEKNREIEKEEKSE